MKAIFLKVYEYLNQHAKFIELIGVLGTLAIISYQSAQMNNNLEEMRKNYSLDVVKMIHEHKQRINNVIIEDENKGLRQVFNLNKKQVMFFIMINDYSNLFLMRKQGLVQDEQWEEAENLMVGQISHLKSLYDFWNLNKKYFNPKFVGFLDPKINKNRPEHFGISSNNNNK